MKRRGVSKEYPYRGEEISKIYPHIRNWIVFAEQHLKKDDSYAMRIIWMYDTMSEIPGIGVAAFMSMILPQYADKSYARRLNYAVYKKRNYLDIYDDMLVCYGFYVRLKRVLKTATLKMHRENPELKIIAKVTRSNKWGISGLS